MRSLIFLISAGVKAATESGEVPIVDVFATDDEGDLDLGDPDFDVPSFLK